MSGRLIIIEGPDECGKTTLSMRLARALNGVVFHSTASPLLFPALPDYHRNILDNCELNLELGRVVILDRFWPSEVAYGLKLKRPDSGYGEVAEQLSKRISILPHIYIFCFSKNAWVRYQKGHTDPAHSLIKEEYDVIADNYYRMMLSNGLNSIKYVLEIQGADENFPNFVRLVRDCLGIYTPE